MLRRVTLVVVAVCACVAQAHADGILELTVPPPITIECGQSTDPAHTGTATCTTTCGGADVVWSQLQDPYNLPPSPYYANTSMDVTERAADNIQFDAAQEITVLRWWGSWCNDNPLADEFRIRFYDLIVPGVGGTDNVVYEELVVPTTKVSVGAPPVTVCGTAPPGGEVEFRFEADLPAAFSAAANTTYWVEVVGREQANNAVFTWSNASSDENRAKPDGDGASVQWSHGFQRWLTGFPDRAFELTGTGGTGTCSVSFSDVSAPGCGDTETITRTWTATDDCGNTSTCDQIVTVVDATPPTITCPPHVTLECPGDTSPPNTGMATCSDTCGGCTVSHSDSVVPGCGNTETITRTWTATDDCGNTSTCDQIVTVVDATPPVITCPTDVIVTCGESTAPADTGVATATDNCDSAPVIASSDSVVPTTCPADPIQEVIERTWTATDACENSSPCVQTITVLKVVLDLDIKPGSCPNSYNRDSHGVLPVGLLGTADFDVTTVVLDSLRLSRADCVGESVRPNEGPPGPRTRIKDVGTPFDGAECGCHELEGDGIDDLSMKFKTDLVVPDLALGELNPGALVELVVTGVADGCQFIASDCVRLVPPGTGAVVMSVEANLPEAWVAVSPVDLTLDGGGFADFERSFPEGTLVTLTAEPWTADGRPFIAWLVDGVTYAEETTIDVTLVGPSTVRAIYQSP